MKKIKLLSMVALVLSCILLKAEEWAFEQLMPPIVTNISPAHGHAGTMVTITGVNLETTSRLYFANKEAQFTLVSSTVIVAVVPPPPSSPLTKGLIVDVDLLTNEGIAGYEGSSFTFTYIPMKEDF